MNAILEQVARAIIVAGYNPATAENIARIAIAAMKPTDATIERAAEALRDHECQHILDHVVKWERLNEKIKQHFRGKVRVVVDAVGSEE